MFQSSLTIALAALILIITWNCAVFICWISDFHLLGVSPQIPLWWRAVQFALVTNVVFFLLQDKMLVCLSPVAFHICTLCYCVYARTGQDLTLNYSHDCEECAYSHAAMAYSLYSCVFEPSWVDDRHLVEERPSWLCNVVENISFKSLNIRKVNDLFTHSMVWLTCIAYSIGALR